MLLGVIILLLVALMGTTVGVSIYTLRVIESLRGEYPFEPIGPRRISVVDIQPVDLPPITTNVTSRDRTANRSLRVQFYVDIDNSNPRDRETQDIISAVQANRGQINSQILEILRTNYLDDIDLPGFHTVISSQVLEWMQLEFQSNLIVGLRMSDWIS